MDIDKYLIQKKKEIIYNCKTCKGLDPFCDCAKKFNIEIKKVQSNIPEILYDVEPKTLSLPSSTKNKLNEFISNVGNKILYVEGGGAIERNSVASIVLRSLIKQDKNADYVTPFRLSNIAMAWRKESFEEYSILVKTDVIAFTDVGDERRNEGMSTEKLVGSVLRERIYSNKKTVITSSLTIEDFSKMYIKDASLIMQGLVFVSLPTKSIKDIFKDLRNK